MSIELKSIRLPRTSNNPNPSKIYFLKIEKEDAEIRVDLTKDEMIVLYNQMKKEVG